MAGVTIFRITVRGRGGHPSGPHHAIDPIPIAAEIVLAIQAHVAHRINVFDPATVTVGYIHAGAPTVAAIPETATPSGSTRAMSTPIRDGVVAAISHLAGHIAAAHGAQADVNVWPGYPPLVNDADVVAAVADVARRLVGPDAVRTLLSPEMSSEDFARGGELRTDVPSPGLYAAYAPLQGAPPALPAVRRVMSLSTLRRSYSEYSLLPPT